MKVALLVLVMFSACAFAAGLVLPLFKIEPRAEEWTEALKLVAPGKMQSKEFTLLGGIVGMWQGGEWGLALILAVFSIVLPLVKLSILTVEAAAPDVLAEGWRRLMKAAARYAMVEVFVIALLVMLAKGMPGGSRMELGIGTTAFVLSVLAGLAAGLMEKWAFCSNEQHESK
jgi:paraquat-inducible protein A